jgi:hypothetical protein
MSNKSDSKISFINTDDSNTNNTNNINNEKKIYYKSILSSYKDFREYLPEGKEELYNNLKRYKKEFYYIQSYFTKTILIIDGENLLKSAKFQNIFKLLLGTIDFNNYFKYWMYGSDDKTVLPFTSLNLSISQKKKILSLLSENYLKSFNIIFIINTKISDSLKGVKNNRLLIDNEIIFTNDNNSVIFPIYYDKTIIREQDDHIIVFLNIFFQNNNKTHIITADKFRWYKGELSLKNFRFIYDNNELCINLEICNHNTHDMIIYKNNKLLIDNLNYPFLDPKNFNLLSIKNKDISFQSILYLLNYLYIQIKIDNNEYFLLYIDEIINILLEKVEYNYNKIKKILILFIDNTKIKKKLASIGNLSSIEQNIENYKIICNIYLILKTIIIYYHPKQFILDICKIFCYIIDIFDLISDNNNKIKKISYDSNFIINKYFLELYSHNIYLKKTGFVKKDIM